MASAGLLTQVGLEVAIYNPRLDKDGSAGRGIADVLVAALGTPQSRSG